MKLPSIQNFEIMNLSFCILYTEKNFKIELIVVEFLKKNTCKYFYRHIQNGLHELAWSKKQQQSHSNNRKKPR